MVTFEQINIKFMKLTCLLMTKKHPKCHRSANLGEVLEEEEEEEDDEEEEEEEEEEEKEEE